MKALRPALFFDRDGCLTEDAGYTWRLEDLRWRPGAMAAVAAVNAAGWLAVVVTNQGGIGKGLYTEADMHAFHAAMQADLAAVGARMDAFYFSPHHPEALDPALRDGDHPDRKPRPGMLLRAARELGIDLPASALVGDRETDMAAARAAGVRGALCGTGRLDLVVHRLLGLDQA